VTNFQHRRGNSTTIDQYAD
jgi:hypothetical protein